MAKAITISISEELHERLQRLGSDLNRSQVCQRALEAVVERLELRQQRMEEGIDNLAARLAEQLGRDDEESFEAGHEAGRDYAQGWAGLRGLRKLANQRRSFNQRWQCGALDAIDWPDDFLDYIEHVDLNVGQWSEEAFWRGFAWGAVNTYDFAMKLVAEKQGSRVGDDPTRHPQNVDEGHRRPA